jgi:hypothetical protein
MTTWMDEVFGRFCEGSPFSVMTRATLENLFADSFLDKAFDDYAEVQYTKELAFSTVASLLTQVVLRHRPSVRNAHLRHGHVEANLKSAYEKLQHVGAAVCEALVHQTADRARQVLDCWPTALRADPVAGMRMKTLDGTYLAGTQKRLKVLRHDGAAALPGMSVVLRDDRTGLLSEAALREDAYTNERALIADLLAWAQPDDLFVGDRNFCWAGFLFGLMDRGEAYFDVRHHESVALTPPGEARHVGRTATGEVYEQEVEVGPEHDRREVRCITIKLFEPAEDGDVEVRLLSNVPEEKAEAMVLAGLHLRRWRVETASQEMTEQLRCEVNTLGYPKAALFGFSLATCAYNLLAILKGALASVHGQEEVEKKLSTYEMAQEISQDSSGMDKALPASFWRERFARMSGAQLAAWLGSVARGMDWRVYHKARRSPPKKKGPATPPDPPKTKKKGSRRRTHVSTARALEEARQNK